MPIESSELSEESVNIPRSVLARAEKAAAAYEPEQQAETAPEEAPEQQPESAPESNVQSPEEEVVEETPSEELAFTPAEEAGEEQEAEEAATDTGQQSEVERLQHKNAVLQGKYDKEIAEKNQLIAELRSVLNFQETRMRNIEHQMQEMQNAAAKEPPPAPLEEVQLNPELLQDYPEWEQQSRFNKDVATLVSQTNSKLTKMEETLAAVNQATRRARDAAYTAIEQRHIETNANPAFAEFLNQVDPTDPYGRTWRQKAEQAAELDNEQAYEAVFTTFERLNPPPQQPPASASKPSQAKLATQQVPKRSHTETRTTPQGPKVSLADLKRAEHLEVTRQKPAGHYDEKLREYYAERGLKPQ